MTTPRKRRGGGGYPSTPKLAKIPPVPKQMQIAEQLPPPSEQEEVIEVTEPQQVSQVLDPTLLNPHSAQPVPGAGVKVKWDNPAQDPNNRLHIGDDPTGEKNAAKFDAG